jgi:hypothetical protein
MKKYIFFLLFLQSCTQTGYSFRNCSEPELGDIAVELSLSNMNDIGDVVDRMDFSCKEKIQYPAEAKCLFIRKGDLEFGNRGLITITDQYIGECVIHELYHIQLSVANDEPCSSHSKDCGWDNDWLEPILNNYKEIKDETN